MITHSLNIYPNHTYIALHNHWCLPRILTYQTLLLLNHIFYWYMKHIKLRITCIFFIVITYTWMTFRFSSLLRGSNEIVKYSTAISFIDSCLFPPQYWLYISIPINSMNFMYKYIVFYCINVEKLSSSLTTYNLTKNPETRKIKWQYSIMGM